MGRKSNELHGTFVGKPDMEKFLRTFFELRVRQMKLREKGIDLACAGVRLKTPEDDPNQLIVLVDSEGNKITPEEFFQ